MRHNRQAGTMPGLQEEKGNPHSRVWSNPMAAEKQKHSIILATFLMNVSGIDITFPF